MRVSGVMLVVLTVDVLLSVLEAVLLIISEVVFYSCSFFFSLSLSQTGV